MNLLKKRRKKSISFYQKTFWQTFQKAVFMMISIFTALEK